MKLAKINHASAATAQSERGIESALNLLKRDRPINGYGVYKDLQGVRADLAAAKRDIEAAWMAVNSFPWPTAEDYKET